jgi:cytochrome c-type biogenesis protein CcsB
MSALSNGLLTAAILIYLLAMILHAAEVAFAPKPSVERYRSASVEVRELVAVGGGAPSVPAVVEVAGERTGRNWIAISASGAMWLAAAAQLAATATRGLAAHRMPWGNMYEFVLSVTTVGAVAWLAVMTVKPQVRRLGLVISLVQVLLLGIAGMVLYRQVEPLVPALQSYWFVVHVSAAVTASGLFLAAFVPAAMFLIRTGYDKGKTRFPYSLGARVPAAESMERLAFRLTAFSFPIWTFAVAAGSIWAEAAWGRYWGWDPKEVWAFISWVVYAGYLHARATPSVKRTTVAWIAVLGFATMLMNLFGVNIFFTGLHSYAGVN